jgi:hypothetical protein
VATARPPHPSRPRRHYGARLDARTFSTARLMPPVRTSGVPQGAATAH